MAQTVLGVNHPHARKLWSADLAREALKLTHFAKFLGEGDDVLFQEHTNLKKEAGDQITYGLRPQLQGDGIIGDNTLEGNEERLDLFDDAIQINQLRHAVHAGGKMSRKRVLFDLRTEARDALADWWADRLDQVAANHLCGYSLETRAQYTGFNTILAPSANRIIRPNGRANDAALVAGDEMSLSLIDRAKVLARTVSTKDGTGPVMRPIRYMGGEYFVMFLHPYQVHQLRTNPSTIGWADIQKAAMQGGDVASNPIFTGALGIYNGVVLHEWDRIRSGFNGATVAANTRRAVFCGAQSLAVAFGGSETATRFDWTEKQFDYDNQLGVKAGAIFGMKKTRFAPEDNSATNTEDFGTIVASTFSPNPNA